jgi:hypothetical protein
MDPAASAVNTEPPRKMIVPSCLRDLGFSMRVLRSKRGGAGSMARWNTICIAVVNAVVTVVCEDGAELRRRRRMTTDDAFFSAEET